LKIRPKKSLGQHFLTDQGIARRIVDSLVPHQGYQTVLEIGPGMGVLTQYLLQNDAYETHVIEIDRDSVPYLKQHYPTLAPRVIEGDFLRWNLARLTDQKVAIIGNLPYNISSQIFFRVIEQRDQVPEIVCMLQKEVARRLASPPGNKEYGILSVYLQAFYDIEYLFSVAPGAFNPPPKVQSGVIRLLRNDTMQLACDEKLFFRVIKTGFNQRRKTLRNALKPLGVELDSPYLDQRAEQLSVADFVALTLLVEEVMALDSDSRG